MGKEIENEVNGERRRREECLGFDKRAYTVTLKKG